MDAQRAPVSERITGVNGIAPEFDLRPRGRGFVMRGWDFSREEISVAIREHRMLNPAMELGTNVCPWNCEFCFTESPENVEGRKRRLKNELPLASRLALIDEVARLGARAINFVGAGEPTIDPDFWALIERMHARRVTPIVYSEGALRLTKRDFVRRLHDLGATVVLKMNSHFNADYQNAIVRGNGRPAPHAERYTELRNRAVDLLLDEGFAAEEPTRLAFDTIICRQNLDEIGDLHRFARNRNIFVIFVNYLPSGRSGTALHDALSKSEQKQVFDNLATIDSDEFGFTHAADFPYAGGVPCTIRGLGLFVKITGKVFDCPGELVPLGDIRTESLSAIWQRARSITTAFDGRCAPREAFWNGQKRHLPIWGGARQSSAPS